MIYNVYIIYPTLPFIIYLMERVYYISGDENSVLTQR